MLRALAALIVGCAFAQALPPTRGIALPEGIRSARCSADDGRSVSSAQDRHVLRVDCTTAPETIVRCDFDGGEPLDLTVAALCATDTVPASRARTVLVRAQRPAPFTAEWVRFERHSGETAFVVARRAIAPQSGVNLPVSPRDDRFVTFKRSGASPITVRADTLAADGGWILPDAAPGGELVIRVARAAITAIKYHLIGGVPPDRHQSVTPDADAIVRIRGGN